MITYTAQDEGENDWRGHVVDDCVIALRTRYTYPSYHSAEHAAEREWLVKHRECAA